MTENPPPAMNLFKRPNPLLYLYLTCVLLVLRCLEDWVDEKSMRGERGKLYFLILKQILHFIQGLTFTNYPCIELYIYSLYVYNDKSLFIYA